MREMTAAGALLRRMALAAGVITLLTPAAAHAAFGVQSFRADVTENDQTTLFTQAGGHPAYGITDFTMNQSGGLPEGDVKNVRVDVPPGLIPNPEAIPKCHAAQPSDCPANTQVGTTDVTVVVRPIPLQTPVNGIPVYNMDPPPGKVSDFAFGISALGIPAVNRVDIIGGVRDTSDYGVFFTISDIPSNPSIVRSKLAFFGVPADHATGAPDKPFITNPTECGPPPTTKLTVESSTGEVAHASYTSAVGATGCDQVPFDPSISVTPDTTRRDTPAGATVGLHVPQLEESHGIESSHVKDVALTLPEGMTINPSAANGLQTCADAQFAKGTHDPVTCPDGSHIGTVRIVSNALSAPLTGDVWLGQEHPGDRYRLFVRATGSMGLDVRLIGSVRPDPQTGRLTTTFTDNPQVPFTDFEITLRGGARAPIATPLACGPARSASTFAPWSRRQNATPAASFTVTADGKGGACAGTSFAPGFSAGTTSPQAGGDTGFVLHLTRDDGQQTLRTLTVREPPGLLGHIPAVPRCAEAQAAAGTCDAGTRIGTASVLAGAGTEPYGVSGPVYLTGPYRGAPYGLAIVIHALAGPYDLGTVVVRAAIRVDPVDAHLTVESDPIPTILEGVPLRLRAIDVAVDRKGFLFNPTHCGNLEVGATAGALEGASAELRGGFDVTGCEKLPFSPKLEASTTARASTARGASLDVTLRQPPGQMNLRSVRVALPRGFSSRGTTLRKACLDTQFAANPAACKASHIGEAAADSPALPNKVGGPVWQIAHLGKLPTVEVQLSGDDGVSVGLSGTISQGRDGLITTFGAVPDVPVSRFRMTFPQGSDSALSYKGPSLCGRKVTFQATFTGQDGRTLQQTVPVQVTDCPVAILGAKRLKHGRLRVTLQVPAAGRVVVSGKTLRRASRTLKRPGVVHVTTRFSRRGARLLRRAHAKRRVLRTAVGASFRPTARDTGASATTTSRATRSLRLR